MTLRAIEIVESCLNFFAGVAKNDSTSRMFAPPAAQTRCAAMQILSILRVKNSLPLTVFTQLQRREASRLE